MSRTIIDRKWVETFSLLPREERIERLERLTITELRELDALFDAWADPAQLPPPGEGWTTWLMMAGRGYGKTRAGAEWVHRLAMQRKVHIALIGATMDETSERYRVRIEGTAGAAEWTVATPALDVVAGDLAPLGSGGAVVRIAQIGDRSVSRDAVTMITI